MKDVFDLLSSGEKRILGGLALGSAALIVLIAGILLVRNPELNRTRERVSRAESGLRSAEQTAAEKQADRDAWKTAREDLEKLRGELLYDRAGAVEALRVDLGRIMSNIGVQVPPLKYGYSGKDDDPIKKITVSFVFKGSYSSVRGLLAEIEKYPRLLTVESISFQKPGPGGVLDLRLTLAGFHE